MIDEVAIERVRFTCPEGHWEQEVDYDVVRYFDPDGGLLDFYSVNGVPTMSPYDRDGSPLCPRCGRATVAKLVARRIIALPAQESTTAPPGAAQRAGRAEVPLLDARSEPRSDAGDRA